MLIHGPHPHPIADFIYRLDQFCRNDFNKGRIVSERDYVSLLLNYITYPLGPLSGVSIAYSQTLPGSIEQKRGCDGIIIFTHNGQFKVGVFEAKVIKPRWDSPLLTNPWSRFQRQLEKQRSIHPAIAVWEMFINTNYASPFLDPLASTCVKRDVALSYRKAGNAWTLSDLYNLVEDSFNSNSSSVLNISQVVAEILRCDFGTLQQSKSDEPRFYSGDINNDIRIPIIQNEVTAEKRKEIFEFLEQTKLDVYMHIDLADYIRERRNQIL